MAVRTYTRASKSCQKHDIACARNYWPSITTTIKSLAFRECAKTTAQHHDNASGWMLSWKKCFRRIFQTHLIRSTAQVRIVDHTLAVEHIRDTLWKIVAIVCWKRTFAMSCIERYRPQVCYVHVCTAFALTQNAMACLANAFITPHPLPPSSPDKYPGSYG